MVTRTQWQEASSRWNKRFKQLVLLGLTRYRFSHAQARRVASAAAVGWIYRPWEPPPTPRQLARMMALKAAEHCPQSAEAWVGLDLEVGPDQGRAVLKEVTARLAGDPIARQVLSSLPRSPAAQARLLGEDLAVVFRARMRLAAHVRATILRAQAGRRAVVSRH